MFTFNFVQEVTKKGLQNFFWKRGPHETLTRVLYSHFRRSLASYFHWIVQPIAAPKDLVAPPPRFPAIAAEMGCSRFFKISCYQEGKYFLGWTRPGNHKSAILFLLSLFVSELNSFEVEGFLKSLCRFLSETDIWLYTDYIIRNWHLMLKYTKLNKPSTCAVPWIAYFIVLKSRL